MMEAPIRQRAKIMFKNDSAFYYLNKCIPLVENLQEKKRAAFYINIGNAFIDTDANKAEEYLNKSIAISQNTVRSYRSRIHSAESVRITDTKE